MKRHKRYFYIFAVAIIIFILLFTTERYLVKKISIITDNQITIGSITFIPPFSIKFRKVNISYGRFPKIFLRTFSIRRAFTENAFAFSGPGKITISNGEKDVKIKGSVSGNYKEGKLDIKKTYITIEDLGSLEVKGALEQWGKEGVNLIIEVSGTEIDKVKNIFGLNLPFSGKASGTLSFDYSKKEEKNLIHFDINIEELVSEGNKFDAWVKGIHNIKEGRTDIKEGKLTDTKGGEILFNGFIDRENFTLNFETYNMPLEALLNLIPQDIREKYNISVKDGSVSMKDFRLQKVKKNSV